jgi:tetratricopeptide (TPR) repeat protein
MFTDIVGYDSFLKEDDKKAFETRKKNQRIHRRLIKKFNGRWLKEMESGTLASFNSNIDAVMCAVSIHKAAEEIKIHLRIGIHQGDVIFEKKDVLGDGVNIASRIQGLAQSNGIVISEKVYDDIKNKEGLEIEFLGEQILKGVTKPVGAYKVTCRDENLLDFTIDTGELIRPWSFGRLSIVFGILIIALISYTLYYFLHKIGNLKPDQEKSVLVLPFENFTGTDTLDYFMAGMHDAMIGEIGKTKAISVKSKTTANAYKDTEKSIPEISRELGVNTIIEGAVLSVGDSVSLQVKLYTAYPEERELMVQNFSVERSQILDLYNKVKKEVFEQINVILSPEDESLLEESRSIDPEAYDAFLRGQYLWEHLHPDSMRKAIDYFEFAVNMEPDWAAPYAMLGSSWFAQAYLGFIPWTKALPKMKYLDKALELDPNSAITHYNVGIMAAWVEWDWEKAEKELLKSLELYPNYVLCRIYYAHLLMIRRRPDEAVQQANIALELDPLSPLILDLNGRVMQNAGDYTTAISRFEKAYTINPNYGMVVGHMEGIYYDAGEYAKWIEFWKKKSCWDDSIKIYIEKVLYEKGHTAAIKTLIEVDEQYGGRGCQMGDVEKMRRYFQVGDYEKVIDQLEKLYNRSWGSIPYIATNYYGYNEMKDNPRFVELLKKMNLPVD